MLYQVEQRGRQTAFVGEDGAGLVGLYPLLARAAAIAENENSSFAEALSLAAAERGTPLRRVFADEAEALSHDLGHGGAAEQRNPAGRRGAPPGFRGNRTAVAAVRAEGQAASP